MSSASPFISKTCRGLDLEGLNGTPTQVGPGCRPPRRPPLGSKLGRKLALRGPIQRRSLSHARDLLRSAWRPNMSSSEHKSGHAWKALEWLCIKRPLLLQTAGLGGLEVLVQAVQTSARFTDVDDDRSLNGSSESAFIQINKKMNTYVRPAVSTTVYCLRLNPLIFTDNGNTAERSPKTTSRPYPPVFPQLHIEPGHIRPRRKRQHQRPPPGIARPLHRGPQVPHSEPPEPQGPASPPAQTPSLR